MGGMWRGVWGSHRACLPAAVPHAPHTPHTPHPPATLTRAQFERTLIVAEEGAYVSYLEGCTAPAYDRNQLHAAVVELAAAKDAEIKYSTVQNWCAALRWEACRAWELGALAAAAALKTRHCSCSEVQCGGETPGTPDVPAPPDNISLACAVACRYAGDADGRGGIYNFVTKRGICQGANSKISWTQVGARALR